VSIIRSDQERDSKGCAGVLNDIEDAKLAAERGEYRRAKQFDVTYEVATFVRKGIPENMCDRSKPQGSGGETQRAESEVWARGAGGE
jgi:hypothetical protein